MTEFVPIRKAVFPVAGLGTRFLPATKEIPKEMLPLIDRPLIHYGVDEAVASGCTEIIFITGTGKDAIFQYFQRSENLEEHLLKAGKDELFKLIKDIPQLAAFDYKLQERPLGLGHAVLCAEEFCREEFFALLLPDDVMIADPTVLKQLDAVREKYPGTMLSLERVERCDTNRYGIVDAEPVEPGIFRIKGLVEKPEPEHAPSDLAIMGRYILSPSIFTHLRGIKPGKGGEYQLTDAINSLLNEEPVYGVLYKGRRLDCGVLPGWLEATIIKALEIPSLREVVLRTLKKEKII